MKILVIGGTHGNESLGIELVRLLRERLIKGVDTLIANPRAVAAGVRFVETDLNRSFGGKASGYEERRACEITRLVAQYDLVLDFHNTQAANNNCSFIGPNSEYLLPGISALLGLNNCIIATYDCINRQCPNTLSIEISQNDKLDNPSVWRRKIDQLMQEDSLEKSRELNLYRFAGRLTWDQKEKLGIKELLPFQSLSKKLSTTLGLEDELYSIFVGSRFTEYYATLLTKEK